MKSNLTRNFSAKEVSCKCGKCSGLPTGDAFITFVHALDNLQAIREIYGKPMILSSGYRCPEHNKSVSSTGLTGPHTIGAFDTLVHGKDAVRLIRAAMESKNPPTGIGVSQKGPYETRFIHFDWLETAGRPWIWSY